MNKILETIGAAVAAILVVGLCSVLGGTVLFLIWPVAVPAAFPGLVASGALAARLSWCGSVCLSWVAHILIKSTTTTKK